MLKNMSVADAAKSKAMIGGTILIGAGIFLLYKGDHSLGMLAIGNGLGIMGIRDNNAA